MPKVKADVDVLLTVAEQLYKGNIKNLVIKRYKTGKNAGELFAEYSLNDNKVFHMKEIETRQKLSNLIKDGASALAEGRLKELMVNKLSATKEQYGYRLEVVPVSE